MCIRDRKWLSDFIEQHWIWANVIYFGATIAVGFLAIPFSYLAEKANRSIFVAPLLLFAFLFVIPYFATFFVGFYRTTVILWNVLLPIVSDFIAEYRLKLPLF